MGGSVSMIDGHIDEVCPCDTCSLAESCDGWEAQFCCTLCNWYGGGDCENCDPMDV